jgi:hypothetical protein
MAAAKKVKMPKTPASAIIDFRERYRLDQGAVDRLFGFSSEGRACRRWESVGAPYYVSILIAYVDAYGIEKMEELAASLELSEA